MNNYKHYKIIIMDHKDNFYLIKADKFQIKLEELLNQVFIYLYYLLGSVE